MKGFGNELIKLAESIRKGTVNSLWLMELPGQAVRTIEEIEFLSKAVEENASFKELMVLSRMLKPQSYLTLLRAIKTKSAISAIQMDNPYLDEGFAQTLATVLSSQKSIKHLAILSSPVTCKGIGSQGAKAIADALASSYTLQSFSFTHSKLNDRDAMVFANVIANNSKLEALALNDNNIGDTGAKALADALVNNTHIRTLNLSGNKINDEGVKSLISSLLANPRINTINLGDNQIGDMGAKAIAEIIRQSATLSRIFLHSNKISSEGIKVVIEAIKYNRTLTEITLQQNKGIEQHSVKEGLFQCVMRNPFLAVRIDSGILENRNYFSEEQRSCYQECLGALSEGRLKEIFNDTVIEACQCAANVMKHLPQGDKLFENCKKVFMLYVLRFMKYEAVMTESSYEDEDILLLKDLPDDVRSHIQPLLEKSKAACASYEICRSSKYPISEHIIRASQWAKVLLEMLPAGHEEHVHCNKILRYYAKNALSYVGVGKPEAIENSVLGVLPPEVREYMFSFVTPGSVIVRNLNLKDIQDMTHSRSEKFVQMVGNRSPEEMRRGLAISNHHYI